MKKTLFTLAGMLLCTSGITAQEDVRNGYKFTEVAKINVTPVKNQASTGTCW